MADTDHAAIEQFWSWWNGGGADQLDRVFTGQEKADVVGLVAPRIEAISDGLMWEFAPGFDGARHSMTVTAAGHDELRAVARRWLNAAPATDEVWSFSEFRRPADTLDLGINYQGIDVTLADVMVEFRAQESLVDVVVYHPAFLEIDEHDRTGLGYLLLDKCLGELAVEMWIGSIEFTAENPADAVPIAELVEALDGLKERFPVEGNRVWQLAEGITDQGYSVVRVSPPLVALSAPLCDAHVEVTITFDDVDERGMPGSRETINALSAIEDAMFSALGNDGRGVAIETFNGRRIMHFYVESESEVISRMREVLALWDRGGIELNPSLDPGWDNVAHLRF